MALIDDYNAAEQPDELFAKRVLAALLNKAKDELTDAAGGLNGSVAPPISYAQKLRLRFLRQIGFLQTGPTAKSGPFIAVMRLMIASGLSELSSDAAIEAAIGNNFEHVLKLLIDPEND